MLFDGRLLHGTGINQTDKLRHIMLMSAQKPWMRTQDLHTITIAPDVLKDAPMKLLQRLHLVGNGVSAAALLSAFSASLKRSCTTEHVPAAAVAGEAL